MPLQADNVAGLGTYAPDNEVYIDYKNWNRNEYVASLLLSLSSDTA